MGGSIKFALACPGDLFSALWSHGDLAVVSPQLLREHYPMPVAVDDRERQVPRIGRKPSGDFFRPFDREAIGVNQEIFQQERLDLPLIFQSVRVEMNQ